VLRAVADGANTIAAILPHSSYEHISNIRVICAELVKAGYLERWMAIKPRTRGQLSAWAHAPKAAHFRLSDAGRDKLAALEAEFAVEALQRELA